MHRAGVSNLLTGSAEQEINFELEKSGRVFGVITDQSGNPLPNVEVILMSKSLDPNAEISDNLAQQTATDDFGFYSLENVSPGRIVIYCWPIYNDNYGVLITDPFNLESGEEKEVDGQLSSLTKVNIIIKAQKDNSPISSQQVNILHPYLEGFYTPSCIREEAGEIVSFYDRTDSNGQITFIGSALNYNLSISSFWYIPIYQELSISPNEVEKWIDIFLTEQDYTQYIR